MRYFIAAPGGLASGGPELLHQLCHELTRQGYEARMLYFFRSEEEEARCLNPVHSNYYIYENDYVTDMETVDCADACLITPESVCIDLLKQCRHCKRVIWWLSIDFFYENYSMRDGMELKNLNVLHLVQSRYAQAILQVIFGIDREKIRYLSDYLRPEFLQGLREDEQNTRKEDIVTYNPKKGYEITKYFMDSAADRICFVPLIRMTPEEVARTLRSAKVYIDFGSHPGKDRIPREAAVSGCCVITGRQGSAAHAEDVPIPERYKFEDGIAQAPEVFALIEDIFADYAGHRKDFQAYCERIYQEQEQFERDTAAIFTDMENERF